MNPEELQMRESAEEQMVAQDEMATFDPANDLTDDDIAAALGFATTLSEPLLPQDEMDTVEDEEMEIADESVETEEAAEEEPVEEEEVEEEDTDDEQSKEIEEIRKELEQLQKEVYGDETTENTESAG